MASSVLVPALRTAQFTRTLGGALDGVDQRGAQSASLQGMKAGDGRPTRARHLIFERGRVQVCLLDHARAAEEGLHREFERALAGEAHLDPGVAERLETVHPLRMTGLVVGAPQTFRYCQRIQEQIADFVTANSKISKKDFEQYMMATGEMATDVGTILYGKEAVASGLIDKMGGISDALAALHKMIRKQKDEKK